MSDKQYEMFLAWFNREIFPKLKPEQVLEIKTYCYWSFSKGVAIEKVFPQGS
jgi:hypothetical protein